jgi:hypothetical protein
MSGQSIVIMLALLGSPEYRVREAATRSMCGKSAGLNVAAAGLNHADPEVAARCRFVMTWHARGILLPLRGSMVATAYDDLTEYGWVDRRTAAYWNATFPRKLLIYLEARALGLARDDESVGFFSHPDDSVWMEGWLNIMRKRANRIHH